MKRGFTLIELLVVIAIIGIIAAIIIVNLAIARPKARDARRKADLDQIRNAVEMYMDENGSPPGVAGTLYASAPDWDSSLSSALSPFLFSLPKDPLNGKLTPPYIQADCTAGTLTGLGWRYRYGHNGSTYELNSFLERDCAAVGGDGGGGTTAPDWYEIGTNLNLI